MEKQHHQQAKNGSGAPEASQEPVIITDEYYCPFSQEPVIITEHQNYVRNHDYHCPLCGNAFQTMDTVFIAPNGNSGAVLCYNCVENLEQIPNRIRDHISFLVCEIEDLQDYAYREFRIERLKKD